jgi:recombination protein RecR
MFSPLIDELMTALRCLPGVGAKSAQRMAFYLLERDRPAGSKLALSLQAAVEGVGRCDSCRTLTEASLCHYCASDRRDAKQLCVVETPADVVAIEQSGTYNGRYFVLLGHLSPLDGIGPQDIGIDLLLERLRNEAIEELILATNPTIEGEATASYISERAKNAGVAVTRIAHGVPLGGELEFIDGGTLAHAFSARHSL